MQIYMVGGAVRDALLGLPVQDRDWVVVGSTPDALIALGYTQVGRDFPVFLHPDTGEEYALARTERKTARGYRGFEVSAAADVTLEQDLARRDLTINSIAASLCKEWATGTFDVSTAILIDPYSGQLDLQSKVLRHVTSAFREDPVRILRLARFAARFADFTVAPETMRLMQDMVQGGEVDALVAERVWQELSRGVMEGKPSRMFDVLRECGALDKLLPEVAKLWDVPQRAIELMLVMDMSAQLNAPLPVRFACLMHDLGTETTPADVDKLGSEANLSSALLLKGVCQRLRVPLDCSEIADVVAREHGNIHRSGDFSAAAQVRLLERCDAFRKPLRFADVLLACECDARGRLGLQDKPYPQRAQLMAALTSAQSVQTHAIAAEAQAAALEGKAVGELIHAARVASVALHMQAG